MGWVEELRGKRVGVDTAPFIYYIEDRPVYADMLEPFYQALTRGELEIVTSVVTLLEVLIVPLRSGNAALAQKYREVLLNTPGLITVEASQEIAEAAANLRANYTIRTPDSLQMATAIVHNAECFLTNDIHLQAIPRLPVLVLDHIKGPSS